MGVMFVKIFWLIVLFIYLLCSGYTFINLWLIAISVGKKIAKAVGVENYNITIGSSFADILRAFFQTVFVSVFPILNMGLVFVILFYGDEIEYRAYFKALANYHKAMKQKNLDESENNSINDSDDLDEDSHEAL